MSCFTNRKSFTVVTCLYIQDSRISDFQYGLMLASEAGISFSLVYIYICIYSLKDILVHRLLLVKNVGTSE